MGENIRGFGQDSCFAGSHRARNDQQRFRKPSWGDSNGSGFKMTVEGRKGGLSGAEARMSGGQMRHG